jgi:hypothetical protein
MAFAFFPLTVAAQTLEQPLLADLCHDDDPGGHCKSLDAREDFTIEAILAAYGEIISSNADDESVFYLTDPGDGPVGAIPLRQITAPRHAMPSHDEYGSADLTKENTVCCSDHHGKGGARPNPWVSAPE